MLELDSNLLAEIGGWPALREARALVERGRVHDARREGDLIRARVQGAEKIYEAQIKLADRVANIEVRCTCAESRRSGRVCAHALAAGLALMQAEKGGKAAVVPLPVAERLPKRWLLEEAPEGTARLEITVLLPLQLPERLARDPVRIILEAQRDHETEAQPFDTVIRALNAGFAVGEEDERVLAALEQVAGGAGGINAVPRAKIGPFFRALSGHPRVWLGKKQRVAVRAATERPRIILSRRADGALELAALVPGGSSAEPSPGGRRLPTPGWHFDGQQIVETATPPAAVSSGSRLIAQAQIPDFLTREFPALERNCELVFAPGFEEFRLELGRPAFEARLEGALSGLTLELVAHYDDKTFSLNGKTESSAYQLYVPDARQPNRFWRRNVLAEREALAMAEAAGFSLVRDGSAMLSLISENQVARFLANTLPRWRRTWTVSFGPRFEATMAEIDVAQPEFSLRPGPGSGSGEDWLGLDLKLSVGGGPVPIEPAEIERWLQTGQTHARMADKRVLLVPTEAWSEMKEVLADCEVEQEPGKIRVARTFAPYLTGALTAQGFRTEENAATDVLPPPPEVKAALAPELWAQLRPYQAHGVEWLAGLAQRNFHGMLADDMGLGKTLQALAFCAWLKANGRESAALVVCPTSLVTNWLREAARFTPQLRTLDLTGPGRAQKLAAKGSYDLLITSYAILRRDVEHYRVDEFSLVILDEAQHIKNRGSQNARSAKALRARRRLILTGTPLENSVLDLWSLYDFLLPGYLGTAADFRERYETPLASGPSSRIMERLRHRVRPFFLRRTKEEVLMELPPKLEFPTLCELTDEQREVYRAVLARGRRDVFEQSGKSGPAPGGGKGRDRIAVLTTLLRLRQVCCHLDLLPQGNEKRVWKEPSAKLDRTFELIDEAMDGGHRVLLFSQFVRVLHLLRDEAAKRELRFCYLDGQTVERQAEVDRFQQDADIPLFFISLKAGGTGLNLTGADTVIHFDPWWNPAVEEQATSRAHRMGQARSVQAYKLIAAGTVEEKIQALQARKRELFQASLGGDEAFVEKLTGDDLEELLGE
ncbi:MAG: SNF2 family helicase [Methylacidiphilales bacterium]|nr:SNF2 family helicase [Candidatus Methylacidiphilales bacterium]